MPKRSTDSVISISSRSGGNLDFRNADSITSNSSACLNCTGDISGDNLTVGQKMRDDPAEVFLTLIQPDGAFKPIDRL
jgi:hypothetical protein